MSFEQEDEIILRGIPISKGIGIGLPIFFVSAEDDVPEIAIPIKEVDLEISRYRRALEMSRQDIESLQKLSQTEGPPEIVSILGTHLEMMRDPLLTSGIEERIRDMQRKPESIFYRLIEEYKSRFSTLKDQYFQERVRDIIDVSRRILGHLRPLNQVKIGEVPHNSIILTHELVPSETVEAKASLVSAFVTAVGGVTSHAAIIARAKGIPYVANVDIKKMKKADVHSLIVDGSQGLVILNPKRHTLKKYQELQRQHLLSYKMLKSHSHLKGETIDGYEVRICANLENPKEIDQVIKAGASGIGLFRSEYLFFTKRALPNEEEQFEIYKRMAKSLKGRPLVIRIFDIGGDKKIDLPPNHPDAKYFRAFGTEPNPALGCRAIRFLLRYPEILEAQLRAILRASHFGQVHILIPMVSDITEVRLVRQKVEEIQADLKKQGIKCTKNIAIGCMIEVPSTAIMSDAIAEEVDFISIGTNDLVQFVLAADRSNAHTADLYFSTHPSILRFIRMVVASATHARKPVILCGECATDPAMIPLFIGLGLREFSVAARHIPLVKHTIRKWRILEACRLAEGALEHTSASDLKQFLDAETVR
ncbi:MAG: phosphoenolpyruvate--protein phosphotransferase [Verrucomicrobia bacterium]|nr:phosphoenolpyruvate--protein phosphotransferase [Verrucomicrobiota bacterium]MBU6446444.1 phosphoenolpyruvate--protein phosphotransferase [Verrucomicrobiota bacterium]MDE3047495.1 phosphoenolpyruvate--protein phosphotransferase [Verrucomicrobiota bacterium]